VPLATQFTASRFRVLKHGNSFTAQFRTTHKSGNSRAPEELDHVYKVLVLLLPLLHLQFDLTTTQPISGMSSPIMHWLSYSLESLFRGTESDLTISVILDNGAHRDFSGIRVVILCGESEGLYPIVSPRHSQVPVDQ